MENQSTPGNLPSQPVKKKRWPLVLLIIFCVPVVLIIVYIAILYFSVNPEEAGSRGLGIISKITIPILKFKCEKTNGVYEEWGWTAAYCYKKSPEAGKDCIQNSDCHGGACRPSSTPDTFGINRGNTNARDDEWYLNSRHNTDGYVFGTCSDAEYYPDGIIPADHQDYPFCGSSIMSPTSNVDYNITLLFCD
ncbi:MAG: hypothetical protein WCV50_02955 [Patescibacteria group bacterium]|jgi:hypothetical protein